MLVAVLLSLFLSCQAVNWSQILGRCIPPQPTVCRDGSLSTLNRATCKMECPAPPANPLNCLIDPCQHAVCPGNSDAICRPNYYTCTPRWFDKKEREVDCTACRNQVNCFVSPCSVSTCPRYPNGTAYCVDNYCGGCKAEWYKNKQKVDCGIDCSLVRCAAPNCTGAYLPPGECCLRCPEPAQCPRTLPSASSTCTANGLRCNYPTTCPCNGNDITINATAICDEGIWRVATPSCPLCENCEVVDCAPQTCPGAYTPPGSCCQECPMCAAVLCAEVNCTGGVKPVTKPGECCPTCPKVDCTDIFCTTQFCEGQYIPEGECCPVCPVDCTDIFCTTQFCEGQYIPEGECCPVCPDPCAAVSCEEQTCPGAYTPPGQCCPECPMCAAVLCQEVNCTGDIKPTTLPGECCPSCPMDCSVVSCAVPVCANGKSTFVPAGKCCPECEP